MVMKRLLISRPRCHDTQALSGHHLFSIGMKVYVEKARPQVATEEMYDENAPLFLTFQNEKEYRTGNKVIILACN